MDMAIVCKLVVLVLLNYIKMFGLYRSIIMLISNIHTHNHGHT